MVNEGGRGGGGGGLVHLFSRAKRFSVFCSSIGNIEFPTTNFDKQGKKKRLNICPNYTQILPDFARSSTLANYLGVPPPPLRRPIRL